MQTVPNPGNSWQVFGVTGTDAVAVVVLLWSSTVLTLTLLNPAVGEDQLQVSRA